MGRLQYSVSKLPWHMRDSPWCIPMTFLLASVVRSCTAELVVLWHCIDICRCWQSIVSWCGVAWKCIAFVPRLGSEQPRIALQYHHYFRQPSPGPWASVIAAARTSAQLSANCARASDRTRLVSRRQRRTSTHTTVPADLPPFKAYTAMSAYMVLR